MSVTLVTIATEFGPRRRGERIKIIPAYMKEYFDKSSVWKIVQKRAIRENNYLKKTLL